MTIITINLIFMIKFRKILNVREYLLLCSNRLYIVINISKSSALFINVFTICYMHDLDGALFLDATFSLDFLFATEAKNLLSYSEQYMHHYSHTI